NSSAGDDGGCGAAGAIGGMGAAGCTGGGEEGCEGGWDGGVVQAATAINSEETSRLERLNDILERGYVGIVA
ncbi:MAG: hypothetical protein WBG17_03050, partial [Burkholderiaceae bacterium]